MDSLLEGQYANDDATYKLVELPSKCLQSEPRDWPDTKFLLAAVTPLQILKNCFCLFWLHVPAASDSLFDACSKNTVVMPTMLSPLVQGWILLLCMIFC